jgi:hypothetical protein
MSFEIGPLPRTETRPRGRGGGFFTLIILGVLALMFLQFIGSRMAPGPQAEPADRPSAGREVDVPFPPATGSTVQKEQSRTNQGDWSLEEVEVKPGTDSDSDVSLTLPGSPADAAGAADPKRTTKGDWSLEEVEASEAPSNPR